MGYLHYGGVESFAFEDRALTHLRAAVFAKLNLKESFVLTWISEGQQHSIWVHPAVPLHFEFNAEETQELNPHWIDQIMSLANSTTGVRWIGEPDPKDTGLAA